MTLELRPEGDKGERGRDTPGAQHFRGRAEQVTIPLLGACDSRAERVSDGLGVGGSGSGVSLGRQSSLAGAIELRDCPC